MIREIRVQLRWNAMSFVVVVVIFVIFVFRLIDDGPRSNERRMHDQAGRSGYPIVSTTLPKASPEASLRWASATRSMG